MALIEFKDLPDTSTPINAENLNLLQENIENEINKAKTITLNGEWIYGTTVYGGATRVRIPIFNPTNTKPKISLTGQHYSTNSIWENVENLEVGSYGTTFVELSMTSSATERAILLRFYGTIECS